MAYGTSGIFGNGQKSRVSAGSTDVIKTGELLYSDSSIALGTQSVTKSQSGIQAPNGFASHNLTFQLTVTDTTGTTAPSGVASIESVLEKLVIVGKSGRIICDISGVNGEFERWQHRLNSSTQYYTVAPTPTDSAVSTAYSATWNFTMRDLVIPNGEYPLTIRPTYNTVSSRATTLNSMTSTVTSFSIWADFVPLASGVPVQLRTIQVNTQTGIISFGNSIDQVMIYDLSLDVGADSNLSTSNTFNLAVNNNSLIGNADYQVIISKENQSYPITTPHISGFFPFNVLVTQTINGTQKVTLSANVSTAPSVGGNANTSNLYMLEAY